MTQMCYDATHRQNERWNSCLERTYTLIRKGRKEGSLVYASEKSRTRDVLELVLIMQLNFNKDTIFLASKFSTGVACIFMDSKGSRYLRWLLWMLMVESLDNPHCLFPILGFQFRGINAKPEKHIVSFGQVNGWEAVVLLWHFSSQGQDTDLQLWIAIWTFHWTSMDLAFLILDPETVTVNIPYKIDHSRRLHRSQDIPSGVSQ